MPVDYNKGRIYKIVSDQTDDVYIGSTCVPLCRRLANHKSDYKSYLNGKSNYITSYDVIKHGDSKIYLIEEISCTNKEQLHKREGEVIKEYKLKGGCVNKKIEGRTHKEYLVANKDKMGKYIKEYREANKDKKAKHDKEYREANKDKIKEYREANKDKKAKHDKLKDKRSQKYTCEVCDKETLYIHKARHERSKKHLQNLL
jgi:hypothetical protein